MEIVQRGEIDPENINKRLLEAEVKIWNKTEDMAYALGKHLDEVYA